MELRTVEITWGGIWKIFVAMLAGWLLYMASDVALAVVLAVIISAALDHPVSFLERKRIPRVIGTLGLFIAIALAIALVAYTIVPLAIFEMNHLLASINKASGALFDILQSSQAIEALNQGLNQLSNALIAGNISLADIVSRFFGGAFLALSVFVLSFYLTLGRDGVEKFLIAILPQTYEMEVVNVYTKVRIKIGRWLSGQLVLSFAMGVLVFLGLWILDVKYSLILGILAGLLELVPFVGPIFSGSMAMLTALGTSLTLAMYVFVFFVALQQLENHVLVPAVTKFTTSLNPVVVLIALLVGGKTFGFVGLILAVPVAVFVQELIEDWTRSKARKRGLV